MVGHVYIMYCMICKCSFTGEKKEYRKVHVYMKWQSFVALVVLCYDCNCCNLIIIVIIYKVEMVV